MEKIRTTIQQRGETAILVVEQSTAARLSLSELFRDEGYQVSDAADSGAAIDIIENNKSLNVVLIDLDMPAWDAVIKRGRQIVPNAHILSMVGFLSINNVSEAEHLGSDGHFLKPLDFAYLHQSIQSILAKKASV